MILGICVPHNFYAPWDFVVSSLNIPAEFMPPIYETGADVALNRDRLLERANKKGQDLLLIDSDATFTPTDIYKIQDHLKEKDVITGVCSVGHDSQPSIYIWSNKGFGHYMPKGVEKIDGTGGYFLGISKRIYNKLPIHPFERISGFGNDL